MRRAKIKTWEQMAKEFGITDSIDINTKVVFTSYMESLLPSDRVIDLIGHYWNVVDGNCALGFYLCDDTIEYWLDDVTGVSGDLIIPVSNKTVADYAKYMKEENNHLWDRITKLEADKTVLVEALEEIISNDWCTYTTRTIVLKAMEAVKEND